MAKVLVSESNLTNIANAIRSKNGSNNTYTPAQMAPAILAIPTGGGSSTLWNINITQSEHQTISVATSISKTGTLSYTIGVNDTPTVVATVTPDTGYVAGAASVQQSGTTFNVSASAATPETTTDIVKNYSNVVATINGENFNISSLGNYSDGWWVSGGVTITQYYGYIALDSAGSSSNHVAYTFTGTLTLDGHELDFTATNWEGGTIQFTENANLSAFKTYYQSLGNGSHTFSTVTLRLTNVTEKYGVLYSFSSSMDSSAMPSQIYWSSVVSDANAQLNNTVPSVEYLSNGATTTVWTPTAPSSTVLTDNSNNCTWTFSGYSPASVGGDTINNAGREYVISYSWVASPMVVDTSVSTYEMVIGADENNGWYLIYGYMPNMSTGSFICTAGYNDTSYGGFYEILYDNGSGGYAGGIGFCDSQGGFITLPNQPTYKIFCNNQLIYDSSQSDGSVDVSSLSETTLASRIGQTVIIKVY